MIGKFFRSIFGRGRREMPLEGVHRAVLLRVAEHLPHQERSVLEQQVASIQYCYPSPDGRELYLHKGNVSQVLFPTQAEELKLATVRLRFGDEKIKLLVWITHGKVGPLEYSRDIRPYVSSEPSEIEVKIDRVASPPPTESPSLPISPSALKGWVAEVLQKYPDVEVFQPNPDARAKAMSLGCKVPDDLVFFWENTDGLNYRDISIVGVLDVREQDLDGDIWYVIGRQDADLLVLRKDDQTGEIIFKYHDIPPENLGRSFRRALEHLLQDAS